MKNLKVSTACTHLRLVEPVVLLHHHLQVLQLLPHDVVHDPVLLQVVPPGELLHVLAQLISPSPPQLAFGDVDAKARIRLFRSLPRRPERLLPRPPRHAPAVQFEPLERGVVLGGQHDLRLVASLSPGRRTRTSFFVAKPRDDLRRRPRHGDAVRDDAVPPRRRLQRLRRPRAERGGGADAGFPRAKPRRSGVVVVRSRRRRARSRFRRRSSQSGLPVAGPDPLARYPRRERLGARGVVRGPGGFVLVRALERHARARRLGERRGGMRGG
mmetsp:Transcript_14630/g.63374  ORF Transcript_14630/g.63374 Transcript_14630/m.63374 type:complete len:270 (+) Transcript_14630:1434-2243(+)